MAESDAARSTDVQFSEDAVTLTHVFDAPRERVWEAWTKPEWIERWFGPEGYTTSVSEYDVREGGLSHTCMKSPEGRCYWGTGEFRVVDPPKRLVVTDSFADEEGNVVPATDYDMTSDWPAQMLVEVVLEAQNGQTRMTLTHSGVTGVPEEERRNMAIGWSESFDKLDEELAKG